MTHLSRGLIGSLALLFVACTSTPVTPDRTDTPDLTVVVRAEDQPLVAGLLAYAQDPRLHVQVAADPVALGKTLPHASVALTTRTDCTQCYAVTRDGLHLAVRGGVKLGLQYGLAHALEAFGWRFPHPRHVRLPDALQFSPDAGFVGEHAPQIEARRGLHLHTLHPIEPMYDFWLPSPAHLQGALATIDFLVANRGNYLQWAALDDITREPGKLPAWQAHTRALTQAAHARGVRTGIAIQLFGFSNLQNAFDLIDQEPPPKGQMQERLHALLDGNGFDTVNLSFGEFFSADPALFVQRVDEAYAALQEVQPGTEMTATIHVGNRPEQKVTYQGKTQLYYFLVQYTNPAIVPWIHTVMYYDLFEDAGGAYLHQTFTEHRQFLTDHLQAGQPVGYFPESAYWVAFDCTVPTFLPLYVRSRWVDLDGIAKVGKLQDHVTFSSGWEWGYWLTDAVTLRMEFARPPKWDQTLRDFLGGFGEHGPALADAVAKLADVQHDALIGQRLAAYLAGWDGLMDAAKNSGIVSQPTRPSLADVAAMTEEQRTAFATNVEAPLQKLAADMTHLAANVEPLRGDPWRDELADGFEVTAARARFAAATYGVALAFARGQATEAGLQQVEAALADGTAVVQRRHAHLWDPEPARLLVDGDNPTLYQYGYLRDADGLCFWKRERAQLRNLVLKTSEDVPLCVL